jgi:hypothetical protein
VLGSKIYVYKYLKISILKNKLPSGFTRHGILNKEPTAWIDEVRPVSTCIPPFLLGNMPAQPHSVPTPKSMFAVYKNE